MNCFDEIIQELLTDDMHSNNSLFIYYIEFSKVLSQNYQRSI